MNPDNPNSLILDIFRGESRLKMSVSEEKKLERTVSHYSLCAVSFEEIYRICGEITGILNRRRKKAGADQEALANLKKCGQLLWEQLLTRSVRSKLKAAGSRELVLCLDEELVGIPWEILFDGTDFLGLKFNLGRLIRSQHEESQPKYRGISAKPRMLILANPTNDLKSAYDEGINIRDQLDKARDKISVDLKSTDIDALYVKKNLREYDIVHFAGHCECDKAQPQKTGWLLSDGRFTTQDILAMAVDSFLPSLVFSNACQSAQVNKERIEEDYQEKTYSLASAFLFAGVRHYIGSIQRIEDPVSFAFAKEFYARLIKGHPVGGAVRESRLRLVRDYGMDSCLWAGYILYGDPNFVMLPGTVPSRAKRASAPVKALRNFRQRFLLAGLVAVILSGALAAGLFLPSRHPGVYYLYKKAQSAFKAGRNSEVISLSGAIAAKDPGFLDIYPLIADSYSRLGKREEAQKYCFEYMLASEKKNDRQHLAAAYIMLGWFYQQGGSYPKAYEFYQKAVNLSRQNSDKLHEALALRKLAVWHMDKGEDEIALRLLTMSSEINRERQAGYEYHYNLACDYFDLGLLFSNKDDYKTAREFYDKSLKAFNDLHLKNEVSDYYFNLGEISVWEKQYQKALDYYFKGLEIDLAQANSPSVCGDYNMIGELYLEMDNLPAAEDYFKRAESLALRINARMELAAASYDLGVLYKKKSQKSLARQYLRQAQEIYVQVQTPEYKSVQQELLALED